MKTIHRVLYQDARKLEGIPSQSVDMVVTSPPYPMIGMWDEVFARQDPAIADVLAAGDGRRAFALMHGVLDPVWAEMFRVLKDGRFACINIGDATRTMGGDFCLYPNHARILTRLLDIGFSALPDILWRKQTNAPNKFMGSGMLPAGAYVTLEHEYVLILRKGSKRVFKTEEEKRNRQESAIFWEERNSWYSDVWMDIKGTGQGLSLLRERSAAFPFELAYRLVNMYSVKGDVVLDPFLGTGTTMAASMAAGRNSIGVEMEEGLKDVIDAIPAGIVDVANDYIRDRIDRHIAFVENRVETAGPLKYENKNYGFPVMTSQEQQVLLNELEDVKAVGNDTYDVCYRKKVQKISRSIQNGRVLVAKKIKNSRQQLLPSATYFS